MRTAESGTAEQSIVDHGPALFALYEDSIRQSRASPQLALWAAKRGALAFYEGRSGVW